VSCSRSTDLLERESHDKSTTRRDPFLRSLLPVDQLRFAHLMLPRTVVLRIIAVAREELRADIHTQEGRTTDELAVGLAVTEDATAVCDALKLHGGPVRML
jgi:hypothetical protein